ncbi:DDAH [Lepeophtheirus salmonis]|uniref:DDAH n=1 Tax=Lepeophtheirus salmonis TaxID=72036 RepID=A0A7R8D670_LEPSM|nr:DDAH [Lepeophtheirus salmonis]CAF3042250.1 DDAH [Lepeophtheirus salmonis]
MTSLQSALLLFLMYTHAIISRVPHVFAKEKKGNDESNLTDLVSARDEQKSLIDAVRNLGVDVLELPPEECSSNSIYVRDLAIVLNGVALMCRPSRDSSRDVELKTIKSFFVGTTGSTNTEGALAVANTWPEYPCTAIKVDTPEAHLRDFICMGGPDLIMVNNNKESQCLLKRIERESIHKYSVLSLPDTPDCLYINGTLIHSSTLKINEILSTKTNFSRTPFVCSAHLAPSSTSTSAALSSIVILIKKSKYIQKL